MALTWIRSVFSSSSLAPATKRLEIERTPVPRDYAVRESLQKPGSGDPACGFRRITKQDERRDLSPVKWEWQQKLGNWLWATHPIAKKCIKNHKNFICGNGFKVQAISEDETKRKLLQNLLDEHWSINEWEKELSRRVETLAVEGEWLYYAPPPDATGHFKLCKILPENVSVIEQDQEDAEKLGAVKLTTPLILENGIRTEVSELSVIRRDWRTKRLVGNALYLGINRLSGQTRGFSDLLVAADHLDLFDQVLFTEAERIGIQRAFVWDVLLQSKDPNKIASRRKQLEQNGPPRPGSVNVHDSEETWTCVSPELHLGESIQYLDILKAMICAGLDNPIHWLSEGGDVNKATASEMGGPAFAFSRERNREIITFINECLHLAIQRWKDAGTIPPDWTAADLAFQVISKDPEKVAYQTIGAMLQSLGQGLAIGQDRGYFSDQEAARAYRLAATHMGLGDFPGVPDPATLEQAKAQVQPALDALIQQSLTGGKPNGQASFRN